MRILIWLACAVSIMVHGSAAAALTGTVTDTGGSPLPGAIVTFIDEDNPDRSFRDFTDETGRYDIDFTAVSVEDGRPAAFSLGQNYPNPFNPATTIPFTRDVPGHVTLTVYNILGQPVRTLVDGHRDAGAHSVVWDAADGQGKPVGAGIYLYVLRAHGTMLTGKMLLMDGGAGTGGVMHSGGAGSSFKRAAIADERVYTVSVRRFGYAGYEAMHVAGDTAVYDVALSSTDDVVTIPGGTFQMGGVEGGDVAPNELPVHTVTVSGFEMGAYEITNDQYCDFLNAALASGDIEVVDDKVYGTTGSWAGHLYFEPGYSWTSAPTHNRGYIMYDSGEAVFYIDFAEYGYGQWPVIAVTWFGAKAFAQYYGFDLPTEAEWEYASRAGMQYTYGTDDGTLVYGKANCRWTDDEWYNHPVTVGSYPANPFGLYDMAGNVWELCHDWSGTYPEGPVANPTGPESGKWRVCRGCSYADYGSGGFYCRSAVRHWIEPEVAYRNIGFRIVRREGGVVY